MLGGTCPGRNHLTAFFADRDTFLRILPKPGFGDLPRRLLLDLGDLGYRNVHLPLYLTFSDEWYMLAKQAHFWCEGGFDPPSCARAGSKSSASSSFATLAPNTEKSQYKAFYHLLSTTRVPGAGWRILDLDVRCPFLDVGCCILIIHDNHAKIRDPGESRIRSGAGPVQCHRYFERPCPHNGPCRVRVNQDTSSVHPTFRQSARSRELFTT